VDIDGTLPAPPPVLATDGDEDRPLVIQAQAGHREAREELARRLRRPAFLLALQIVGNPDDALDIAQGALLRFFHSLDRFQSERAVRPWLFTIVRNEAKDLWRRRRIRPAESVDLLPSLADTVADTRPDPEERALLRERRRQLWHAMGALREHHREIVVLRDFHDLSYAEIALVLKIPTGTVMSRLHAARMALKHLVQEERAPK
jgi:RNA polymerase sigma-70 factor (ECF subfamily)